MLIRAALPQDTPGVASLLTQLGYPTTAPEAERRLADLDPRIDPVWVAVVDDRPIGLATAHLRRQLETDVPTAELTVLVVDEEGRSHGTGAQLLQQAEEWAAQQGCTSLSVASSTRRERAHSFYVRNGFEERSKKFLKRL